MKKNSYIGKTKEEAIEIALGELNANINEVIIIEKETKTGLFKSKKVEIEVVIKEEVNNYIKEFILNLVKNMGLEANLEVKKREDSINFILYSDNNAILIGKNGRTIDALSVITKQSLLKQFGVHYHFNLDVSEYKEHRKNDLERMAKRLAKDVIDTNIEVKLDSMNSYERRIIHNALSENNKVYTESEGEEPNRYIIIKPRS